MPQSNPKPGEKYLHFKQKMYQIVTIAEHSETGEKLVIYQALYGDFKTYARPLEMFVSKVDKEKYPQAEQTYRFQLVEQSEAEQPLETPVEVRQRKESSSIEEKMAELFDAETVEEKYQILITMEEGMTDHIINNLAVALDLVIKDGPVEKRFEELKNCVRTMKKYESARLR